MKIANSILTGLLTVFVIYFIFLSLNTGHIENVKILGFLLMALISSWQQAYIIKFKDLYEAERKKNEDLINGIQETKGLIKQALVNKN